MLIVIYVGRCVVIKNYVGLFVLMFADVGKCLVDVGKSQAFPW